MITKSPDLDKKLLGTLKIKDVAAEEKTDPLKAKAEFPPEEHADPEIPLKLDPCVAKAKVREVAKKLKKSP